MTKLNFTVLQYRSCTCIIRIIIIIYFFKATQFINTLHMKKRLLIFHFQLVGDS